MGVRQEYKGTIRYAYLLWVADLENHLNSAQLLAPSHDNIYTAIKVFTNRQSKHQEWLPKGHPDAQRPDQALCTLGLGPCLEILHNANNIYTQICDGARLIQNYVWLY